MGYAEEVNSPGEQKPSRRYGVFQALFMSFYSQDLYRDVGRHWKNFGFAYLLLLSAIVWIPCSMRIHKWVVTAVAEHAPEYFNSIPAFELRNGVLTVDVKQPYIIKDNDGKTAIIVDTTGEYTSLDQVPKEQMGRDLRIFMKDRVLVRNNRLGRYKDDSIDYSMFNSFEFNREKLIEGVNLLAGLTGPLVYPFAVLISFVVTVIAVLMYALIGLGIANNIGSRLDYETSLRLTAVSHTPAILLATICFVYEINVPGLFLVFFALPAAYLFLAVKSCATGK